MTATPALLLSVSILKVVYSSIIASVAVSVVFAFAVLGTIRAGDSRRARRRGAALAYGTLATVAVAICAASVVYGVILVGHKS